jgi:hypothetical protein
MGVSARIVSNNAQDSFAFSDVFGDPENPEHLWRMSIMVTFQAFGTWAIQMAGVKGESNDRAFSGRVGVFAGGTETDREISQTGS